MNGKMVHFRLGFMKGPVFQVLLLIFIGLKFKYLTNCVNALRYGNSESSFRPVVHSIDMDGNKNGKDISMIEATNKNQGGDNGTHSSTYDFFFGGLGKTLRNLDWYRLVVGSSYMNSNTGFIETEVLLNEEEAQIAEMDPSLEKSDLVTNVINMNFVQLLVDAVSQIWVYVAVSVVALSLLIYLIFLMPLSCSSKRRNLFCGKAMSRDLGAGMVVVVLVGFLLGICSLALITTADRYLVTVIDSMGAGFQSAFESIETTKLGTSEVTIAGRDVAPFFGLDYVEDTEKYLNQSFQQGSENNIVRQVELKQISKLESIESEMEEASKHMYPVIANLNSCKELSANYKMIAPICSDRNVETLFDDLEAGFKTLPKTVKDEVVRAFDAFTPPTLDLNDFVSESFITPFNGYLTRYFFPAIITTADTISYSYLASLIETVIVVTAVFVGCVGLVMFLLGGARKGACLLSFGWNILTWVFLLYSVITFAFMLSAQLHGPVCSVIGRQFVSDSDYRFDVLNKAGIDGNIINVLNTCITNKGGNMTDLLGMSSKIDLVENELLETNAQVKALQPNVDFSPLVEGLRKLRFALWQPLLVFPDKGQWEGNEDPERPTITFQEILQSGIQDDDVLYNEKGIDINIYGLNSLEKLIKPWTIQKYGETPVKVYNITSTYPTDGSSILSEFLQTYEQQQVQKRKSEGMSEAAATAKARDDRIRFKNAIYWIKNKLSIRQATTRCLDASYVPSPLKYCSGMELMGVPSFTDGSVVQRSLSYILDLIQNKNDKFERAVDDFGRDVDAVFNEGRNILRSMKEEDTCEYLAPKVIDAVYLTCPVTNHRAWKVVYYRFFAGGLIFVFIFFLIALWRIVSDNEEMDNAKKDGKDEEKEPMIKNEEKEIQKQESISSNTSEDTIGNVKEQVFVEQHFPEHTGFEEVVVADTDDAWQ